MADDRDARSELRRLVQIESRTLAAAQAAERRSEAETQVLERQRQTELGGAAARCQRDIEIFLEAMGRAGNPGTMAKHGVVP